MLKLLAVFLGAVRSAFGSRADVALENLGGSRN
jgi:hypothetical protein